MRKIENRETINGYLYQCNVVKKITGENSKNPGTPFFSVNLDIAVDEEGLNVISVHFTYVAPQYSSGKTNNNFAILERIVESPERTWVAGGKESAFKLNVDASLALNDFYNAQNVLVSSKKNEASFISIVSELKPESERNTFRTDMVITKVKRVEADPERYIDKDYVTVGGAVFDFRNALLPVEFVVRNESAMNYFEDLSPSSREPVFTKVWGRINSTTKRVEKREESAFGEDAITTYERTSREWLITGAAKVPYEFDNDSEDLTVAELTKAQQDREVYLADVKKRQDEWTSRKVSPQGVTVKESDGFDF